VHNLDDRIRYQGLAPDIFFKKCYGIRSLLVHGSSDTPTPEEVDEIAASLEVMVSDLLSVPTLGFQSHREP
jgi:hypothetical protein